MRILVGLIITLFSAVGVACHDFSGEYIQPNQQKKLFDKYRIQQTGCERIWVTVVLPDFFPIEIRAQTDGVWRSKIKNKGDNENEHIEVQKAYHDGSTLRLLYVGIFPNMKTLSTDAQLRFLDNDKIEVSTSQVKLDGSKENFVAVLQKAK